MKKPVRKAVRKHRGYDTGGDVEDMYGMFGANVRQPTAPARRISTPTTTPAPRRADPTPAGPATQVYSPSPGADRQFRGSGSGFTDYSLRAGRLKGTDPKADPSMSRQPPDTGDTESAHDAPLHYRGLGTPRTLREASNAKGGKVKKVLPVRKRR